MRNKNHTTLAAYIAVIVTISLFSSIEVVAKTLTGKIDPVLLAALRFGIGGILLLSISHPQKVLTLKSSDRWYVLFLSLFGVSGAFILFHRSLYFLDASAAAVLFSINPIFCTLIAALVTHEKISFHEFTGLLLGFAAVYLVSFGSNIPEISNTKGPLMMVTSAFLFSVYIVGSKKTIQLIGKRGSAGLLFTIGAIAMIPFTHSWHFDLSPRDYISIGYLVLGTTALAYILYFYGIGKLGVAKATAFFYLKPFFATILAMLFLNERPDFWFYVGVILAAGALLIPSLAKRSLQKT